MYRDSSEHVDEHDSAAASILMAETLLATCNDAARTVGDSVAEVRDRWLAIMQLHDTFPDVWRALDRARGLLAARGANTMAYDELAPTVRRNAIVGKPHGIGRDAAVDPSLIDRSALADARRATEQLKLGLPGADWSAIEARTRGLAGAQLRQHRRPRLVVGIGTALVSVLAVGLLVATPSHARHVAAHGASIHEQLAQITSARATQIAELAPRVAASCDPPAARRYAQLLVMDGRGLDAGDFAADYADRCGADPVVENWANAPLPPSQRGDDVHVIDFPALDVTASAAPPMSATVSPQAAPN